MLVLSRKAGEYVQIANNISVKVIEIEGDKVRLGFIAPANIPIHRQEVYLQLQKQNRITLDKPTTPPIEVIREDIDSQPHPIKNINEQNT